VVRDKMNQSYKEKMELYRSLESDPWFWLRKKVRK
jgi:hypothetical protein